MSDELISVIDLADQYGKRKQTIFKVLRRLGIETKKLRSANNRGQVIAYITNDESRLVILWALQGWLRDKPLRATTRVTLLGAVPASHAHMAMQAPLGEDCD